VQKPSLNFEALFSHFVLGNTKTMKNSQPVFRTLTNEQVSANEPVAGQSLAFSRAAAHLSTIHTHHFIL
jgi:hypothetical protein